MSDQFERILETRQVINDALIDAQASALVAASQAAYGVLSGIEDSESLIMFADPNILMYQVYSGAIEALTSLDTEGLIPEIITAAITQYTKLSEALPLPQQQSGAVSPSY